MVCYSEDSSDGEKIFYHKKDKLSLVNHQKSKDVSTAHGIVVNNRSPTKKKSPPKQSRQIDDSDSSEIPIKEQVRKNYGIQNSSDEEQVTRSNTNVKVEQSLSDDKSEDETYKSSAATRGGKNSFDEENSLIEDQDQSVSIHEANETGINLPHDDGIEKPIKRRRILIKKEVMSSEDEVPPSRKDPDKRNQKNLSEFESDEQKAGNSSDSEIPPSQYWLHKYKEVEKNSDEKRSMKISPKKSLPMKNLDSDEESDSDQKKRMSVNTELIVKRESESQRKSPPRITKTEIISTKYKRIDQRILKDGDEVYLEKDHHGNIERKEKMGSSSSDDNENNAQILSENGKFRGIKSSKDESDVGKVMSQKKISPKKISQNKRQSPKKNQASPPKRKLKLEPKVVDDIEVKSKTNKKNTSKRNLATELNDKPLKTRPNICDTATSSEEEERVEKKETPKNYVLSLEKSKNTSKETSKPNGTQMVLVRKSNQLFKNDQLNLSYKSQSSPRKALISHQDNLNDEYSSEESSSNVVPSSTIEKKLSPKKRKHDNDCAEEAEAPVKKVATRPQKQTMKHCESTGSLSPCLKRTLDSDNSSDDDEASSPRNVAKTLLRKEISEDNSFSEIKSNKHAELIPLSKESVHTMSDSDETDSLTKLNTTLNKSMALMENKAETVKETRSGKSVSINTKHKFPEAINIPSDAKAQKSILKKSEQIIQEKNVEHNVQPVNAAPTIIKRPLNLENLKNQESLAYDCTKASFGLEDISDDDEIYILDVPRTVDPKDLKGQTIRLRGKNKLEIGDQLYETFGKVVTNISCVFRNDKKQNSCKTVNLKPAGCISVRQKLSKTLHVELSPLEKRTVPFPGNLKIRHPLFGAEYEDKIANTEKKVIKKTSRSKTREKSIANEGSKVEQRQIKLKNVEKHKNSKDKLSQELNKSENNSIDKLGGTGKVHSNDSVSSNSDSNESFFQIVKRETIGKRDKGKKSKNLLSLLNLDETPVSTDLPVQSEFAITSVKRKGPLANKKFGLSLNSSVTKNDGFLVNTKNSLFFSSTPIKVENNEEHCEGEILTNKVRKRKTLDNIVKGTESPKKVKTN